MFLVYICHRNIAARKGQTRPRGCSSPHSVRMDVLNIFLFHIRLNAEFSSSAQRKSILE